MRISYFISKLIKKIQIPAIKESEIPKTSKISSGSHIVNSKMGKYSYVGNFATVIDASIGSFCSIADNCIIGGASHPTKWVSTSPVFHKGRNILRKNFSNNEYNTSKRTNIGNDVWIGNNALIKGGVKISNGAVIGMGSIVTKNVGPYEIWAGNPAKFIKYRYPKEKIKIINDSMWWNWNEDKLRENADCFNDIDKFIYYKLGEMK